MDFDPTLWPAALEPDGSWCFVGNAKAVSPFLVRLDTISAGEQHGVAFRGYVLWFFGATHELVFTWGELWHYEKTASGGAHGMVGNTIVIK